MDTHTHTHTRRERETYCPRWCHNSSYGESETHVTKCTQRPHRYRHNTHCTGATYTLPHSHMCKYTCIIINKVAIKPAWLHYVILIAKKSQLNKELRNLIGEREGGRDRERDKGDTHTIYMYMWEKRALTHTHTHTDFKDKHAQEAIPTEHTLT